jgi:tRNA (guanine37-N1)-methyltransferase
LPAILVVDSITRLLPGAITHEEGTHEESFHGMLEYPQYTRPVDYKGWIVPEILRSGNHKEIEKWRKGGK